MVKPTAVAVLLALAGSVLVGCSVRTAGVAAPADTDGPRPVQAAALHGALLDVATVNDIMGASAMTVRETRTRLFDGSRQFKDRTCMIAWTPAEQTVYAHTGWQAALAQTVQEKPSASSHFVIQAAVAFASRRDANTFFSAAEQKWRPCGGRRFQTDHGAARAGWTFGSVFDTESTLWMTQTRDDHRGWSCQRALRVRNNVAIDVLACKFYAADEAITIVHGIDTRLPGI